jgi:hypothetical protein
MSDKSTPKAADRPARLVGLTNYAYGPHPTPPRSQTLHGGGSIKAAPDSGARVLLRSSHSRRRCLLLDAGAPAPGASLPTRSLPPW